MKPVKQISRVFVLALLCLSLSGCSSLFSDLDAPRPDLVIINDSSLSVGAIFLHYGDHSDGVSGPSGQALLERGDRFGLQLDEGCTSVTLCLTDPEGATLCRCLIDVEDQVCRYAALREDRRLDVWTPWPPAQ